jgi:hypothetical protein
VVRGDSFIAVTIGMVVAAARSRLISAEIRR